ncbi:hypothetical protein [Actinoplanes sp. G11-F43]|uniref:hypothetical protein n=1 Tax=Actinoplanes sp. G11-F43 TaxID=3424130 RepID=UPI003D325AF2
MPDNYDWPLPQAATIDQVLRDLTEHAGYSIADDGELDLAFAQQPKLILTWVATAARYTATDFQLQMLHHSVAWMRMELAPTSDQETEDLTTYVDNLRQLLVEHGRLRTARADAYRDFTRACSSLEGQQVLVPAVRVWQPIELIADGLTELMTVEVPIGAAAPWPLVRAGRRLIDRLVDLPASAQSGRQVLRRSLAGIVCVDHHGARQWVLPDPERRYWLHDFGWSVPHRDAGGAVAVDGGDR